MKVIITKIPAGGSVTLDIPDKAVIKDDGKGLVEARIGTQPLLWFYQETGFLVCDSSVIVDTVAPKPAAPAAAVIPKPPGVS